MKLYVYTVLAFLALIPLSVSASEWTNSTLDNNWNNLSNWNPPGVPSGPGSSALFNGLGTPTVNITSDDSVDSVSLNSGIGYTINSAGGTLTMGTSTA